MLSSSSRSSSTLILLCWCCLLAVVAIAQVQQQHEKSVTQRSNADVQKMVQEAKSQVDSLFQKVQSRIDARKKTIMTHIEATKATVNKESQAAQDAKSKYSSESIAGTDLRNSASRIQELEQRETNILGAIEKDMLDDRGKGSRALAASRMQKTLDAHTVPLALQREIIGMTAANIPRELIVAHIKENDLGDNELLSDANDIVIAANRASGFAPPKISQDAKKAKDMEVAKNLEKFKKAKEAFSKSKP